MFWFVKGWDLLGIQTATHVYDCFREDQEIDGFLCEQTEDEAFANFQES